MASEPTHGADFSGSSTRERFAGLYILCLVGGISAWIWGQWAFALLDAGEIGFGLLIGVKSIVELILVIGLLLLRPWALKGAMVFYALHILGSLYVVNVLGAAIYLTIVLYLRARSDRF